MLTYSMDNRKGQSLYDYLYTCIKGDILNGKLKSGERLPSKRSFSKNLGVSVITVENAYSQLEAEGFIYALEKRGYYVSELSRWIAPVQDVGDYDSPDAENTDMQLEGKDEDGAVPHNCESAEEKNSVCMDIASNIVNYDRFPFSVWSRLTRNILSGQDEGLLRAAPVKGIYALRKSVSGYLYHFRNMNVSPDRIVIGSGTEYLYNILVQLLGRECMYGVEDPGYSKVSRILEGNGVRCVHVPIDSCGMRIEPLRDSGAHVAHLTPSHHFPTGIVMPIQRRLEFLDWAYGDGGRYIIEDDYDCEFRYQGRPIQTMYSTDRNSRVIYINTFSKTLAPSFRISYMVLPRKLADRFDDTMGYMSCTVPNLEQYVLAEFISGGYYERHINRMRVYYRNLRNELLKEIRDSSLKGRCQILEENAGLHFLIKLNTSISDSELRQRALEKGMRLTCVSDYSYNVNNENDHVIIINYSGIQPWQISKAVALLCEITESLK